ncbi:hypothetical protein EV368DRAFT_86015 [Lentinula lateritia]|nr:hypothetical protein EV368DRAFT_86015 [Lentinula lateritia]
MTSNVPASTSSISLESNANTISSKVPLNTCQTPQKDYAAAFGDLQSRYGVAASHNPISTPVVKKKQAKDSTQALGAQSALGTSEGAPSDGSTGRFDGPSPVGLKNKKRGISRFFPWIGLTIFMWGKNVVLMTVRQMKAHRFG